MIIHKYLFFVEENQVCVYYYNQEKREFKCETNQGEKRFPISSDFWNWWIEASSFNKQNDCVDFCFISDKNYDFFKHNFNKANKSIWTNSIIEKFFITEIEYSHIRLKNEEGTIIKSYDKGNKAFSDNSIKIFFTNIHLDDIKEKIPESDNSEEISDFARYFRNKIKKEKSY